MSALLVRNARTLSSFHARVLQSDGQKFFPPHVKRKGPAGGVF